MLKLIRTLALAIALAMPAGAIAQFAPFRPTIILVHGAFADNMSWNAVIAELEADGYTVIAAANPLRGVASDAAAISAIVRSIRGQVILVGHSYGGPVITAAANGNGNVKALVYVAGFVPDAGESSASLSTIFPGSTLARALAPPIALPDGGQDLYIRPELFREQFAADVPAPQAALMAATQRPIAAAALAEASGTPTWRTLPTYMIYGSADRNIPAAVMRFMAERAHARRTVVVEGGSHALMVSHPERVTAIIEEAASAR
jgi:pimeloyl-ACP methyl ester carboxylesterase